MLSLHGLHRVSRNNNPTHRATRSGARQFDGLIARRPFRKHTTRRIVYVTKRPERRARTVTPTVILNRVTLLTLD